MIKMNDKSMASTRVVAAYRNLLVGTGWIFSLSLSLSLFLFLSFFLIDSVFER